jgi:hypothetical protein
MPRIQLLDRATGTWVEFEPVVPNRTYAIPAADRYVDDAGSVSVRFVNRSLDEYVQFAFGVRIAGTVQ